MQQNAVLVQNAGGPGNHTGSAALLSNTKHATLTLSQAAFFKRQASDSKPQARSFGPHTGVVAERNRSNTKRHKLGDQGETRGSDLILENSALSHGLHSGSVCEKPAAQTATATHKLPSIDRKPSSTSN